MSPRILLHLGLHKTATTSLQELVFPHLPKPVFYLGKTRWSMMLRGSRDVQHLLSALAKGDLRVSRLSIEQLCISLEFLLDGLIASAMAAGPVDHNQQKLLQTMVSQLIGCCGVDDPLLVCSAENLLGNRGHLFPELPNQAAQGWPTQHIIDALSGFRVDGLIYLRDPLSYLYSRYVQVHTIRCRSGSKAAVLKPEQFLHLQLDLLRGSHPCRSVMLHAMQNSLVSMLGGMGFSSLRTRSFDHHLKGSKNIVAEMQLAMGVALPPMAQINQQFAGERLNTMTRDKQAVMQLLISACGCVDEAELRQKFMQSLDSLGVSEMLSSELVNF